MFTRRLPRTSIGELDLLAVDFETTGLDPRRDRIVSVGWVPVTRGVIELSDAAYFLVRPDRSEDSVGESATIHLITDEKRAAGVDKREALDALAQALSGRVMLAHFAAIEAGFSGWRGAVVDTFDMERTHMEKMGTYPRGEDLRLARVRQRYGLPPLRSHDALTDAIACAELYLAMTADRQAEPARRLRR